MIKTNGKIVFSIALIILTLIILTNSVFAFNPDMYDPSKGTKQNNTKFFERTGPILGAIQYIGIGIAILTLTVIGIKYLLSSVEGKAEYKKTMLPYIIGCFLLIGASFVVKIIASVATA